MSIQSYKQNPKLANDYEAIIIGSGIGGLTLAALLAKEGKKVLVLERHYTAGGFTHIFKRRGYEWDVGIHYIGEMQRKNSVLRKLFDYISDNNLEWADMGDVYDIIVIGDKKYEFTKGTQNLKKQLKSYFPEEAEGIEKYFNLIFEATKHSQSFFMDKALPPIMSKMAGSFMRKKYLKFAEQTTYSVLKSCTQNEELIKVLTGQYGDYGLPPKQSSFAMHCAVVRHYLSGGSFPVGGSGEILKTIAPVIAKAGGTILTNAEVDEVLIENNKAVGVKMKDGKTINAPKTISSAGYINTIKYLLPNAISNKYKLKENLSKLKHSAAHLGLYIGLNGTPSELNLPKHNLWIYPDDADHDTCVTRFLEDTNNEFPVVYVSFPASKDPKWNERYPNKSTIDIITIIPYKTFEKWKDERWMKRGDEYENLKEHFAQRLLKVLFKHIPNLEKHIDCYELSTPLSTQHFVNYEKGEIYGIDHSPSRFKQNYLRPHTPIKNFYLTGQDVVTAGIGGAMFGGVLTFSAMTKKNILPKVMKS